MMPKETHDPETGTVTIALGREELIIRRRYETLSIVNDFLIALWFLVGSILFLWPATETAAVWLFILGSAQFLARPALRLGHRIQLRRTPASRWDM